MGLTGGGELRLSGVWLQYLLFHFTFVIRHFYYTRQKKLTAKEKSALCVMLITCISGKNLYANCLILHAVQD